MLKCKHLPQLKKEENEGGKRKNTKLNRTKVLLCREHASMSCTDLEWYRLRAVIFLVSPCFYFSLAMPFPSWSLV